MQSISACSSFAKSIILPLCWRHCWAVDCFAMQFLKRDFHSITTSVQYYFVAIWQRQVQYVVIKVLLAFCWLVPVANAPTSGSVKTSPVSGYDWVARTAELHTTISCEKGTQAQIQVHAPYAKRTHGSAVRGKSLLSNQCLIAPASGTAGSPLPSNQCLIALVK
jgi:hypothetical protein